MRTVRLTERELTRIIKRIIKEDEGFCKKEDSMPSPSRPFCSDVKVKEGTVVPMDEVAYLMYKDESNCPKLCKLSTEEKVRIIS